MNTWPYPSFSKYAVGTTTTPSPVVGYDAGISEGPHSAVVYVFPSRSCFGAPVHSEQPDHVVTIVTRGDLAGTVLCTCHEGRNGRTCWAKTEALRDNIARADEARRRIAAVRP